LLRGLTTMDTTSIDPVHETVRERYAEAARAASAGRSDSDAQLSCCEPTGDAVTGPLLYGEAERSQLPDAAVLASLGCGNPTAVAELRPGETVLDLGSGGGIDVLLSARRVGPGGRAIGLDMTDEMLELARRNAADAGASNVEFVKGTIEAIPLPDASVDVVISNCVINLAADKAAVLREIARVLRPGGRVGVSDIVADDVLTPAERAERGSYVGCIAGALSFAEYRRGLAAVGLSDIDVRPTHAAAEGLHSAIIRATKPADWNAAAVRPVDLPRPELSVVASGGCCGTGGCC
jgi:SAM-dependent methyltransferase